MGILLSSFKNKGALDIIGVLGTPQYIDKTQDGNQLWQWVKPGVCYALKLSNDGVCIGPAYLNKTAWGIQEMYPDHSPVIPGTCSGFMGSLSGIKLIESYGGTPATSSFSGLYMFLVFICFCSVIASLVA